jgi:hypothetical protein
MDDRPRRPLRLRQNWKTALSWIIRGDASPPRNEPKTLVGVLAVLTMDPKGAEIKKASDDGECFFSIAPHERVQPACHRKAIASCCRCGGVGVTGVFAMPYSGLCLNKGRVWTSQKQERPDISGRRRTGTPTTLRSLFNLDRHAMSIMGPGVC